MEYLAAVLNLMSSVPVFAKIAKRLGAARLRVSYEPTATGEKMLVPSPSPPSRARNADLVSSASTSPLTANTAASAWRWFHVCVENLGRLPALSTRGYLADLLVKSTSGSYQRLAGWNARLPLQWANTDSELELDLMARAAGPRPRLDVFRAASGGARFELATPKRNIGVPTSLPSGDYRILIEVESRTAPSCQTALSVRLGSNWDDIDIYQIPLADFT